MTEECWILDRLAWTAETRTPLPVTGDLVPAAGPPAGRRSDARYRWCWGRQRLSALVLAITRRRSAVTPWIAMRSACAVELIHALLLVHDDMPCMDDDVLRRASPRTSSSTKPPAMLAGDALQALAFEVLTPDDGTVPTFRRVCVRLARGASHAAWPVVRRSTSASIGKEADKPRCAT